MSEVRVSGDLRGKPAILVHGRADALVPVNHTSRPYTALNQRVEGRSGLRYYEVTDAQHFDALVPFYPRIFVPLSVYGQRALDLMYEHLRQGTALPPSQVVRAVARDNPSTVLTDAHVPPIAPTPTATNAITVTAGELTVSD